MNNYKKHIIVSLLLLLQLPVLPQNIGTIINLNTPNGGGTYIGRQKVSLQAGFSFSSSNNSGFSANAGALSGSSFIGSIAAQSEYSSSYADLSTREIDNKLPVGTIPGSFAVSPTGAATYSVPIEVIPGTGGMQPNLSVVYSSQSGNGLLGRGWMLSGLSAITQIPSNNRALYYPSTAFYRMPRYALDGQILLDDKEVTGDWMSSFENNSYKTETDDYKSIIQGSNTFTVTTYDGIVRTYGTSDNSRIKNGSSTRIWLLDKVIDPQGNYMTYSYLTRNNETVIASILYTGNSTLGIAPYAEVIFQYDDRNSVSNGLGDASFTYTMAGLLRQNLLLRNIRVNENGKTARVYNLDYCYSSSGSLLKNITLLSGISGEALNDTRFVWNMPSATEAMVKSSLSTELKNDWGVVFNNTQAQVSIPSIDNDGKTDMLYYKKENNEIKAQLRSSKTKSIQYEFSCPNPQGWDPSIETADFNADGLSDIIVRFAYEGIFDSQENCAYVILSPQYNSVKKAVLPAPKSTYDIGDYFNDGHDAHISIFRGEGGKIWYHFIMYSDGNLITDCRSLPTTLSNAYSSINFGNFGSDGSRQVLAIYGGSTSLIQFRTIVNYDAIDVLNLKDDVRVLCVGDFNADGRSDILTVPKGQGCGSYKIGFFNGSSFDFSLYNGGNNTDWNTNYSGSMPDCSGSVLECSVTESNNKVKALSVDINNDGYSDVVVFRSLNTYLYFKYAWLYNTVQEWKQWDVFHEDIVFINQKNGSFTRNTIHSKNDHVLNGKLDDYYCPPTIGDFDGDGQVDICYLASLYYVEPYCFIMHSVNNHSKTQISQISDGLNNLTTIDYGLTTDPTVHTAVAQPTSEQPAFTKINYSVYDNNVTATPVTDTKSVISFAQPISVVRQFQRKSPYSINLPAPTVMTYFGARIATDGRGFLGFYNIISNRAANLYFKGEKEDVIYLLDSRKRSYPYYITKQINDKSISITYNNLIETQNKVDPRIYFPHFSYSKTEQTAGNSIIKYIEYDTASSIRRIKTIIDDDFVTKKVTKFDYTGDAAFDALATITKKTYYTAKNQNCVVFKDITTYVNKEIVSVESFQNDVKKSTTTYKREGKTITTTFTPAVNLNSQVSRSTSCTYDPTWRYITKSCDAMGNCLSTTYNTAFGKIETSFDTTMGKKLVNSYDGFGNLVQTKSMPDGIVMTYKTSASKGNTVVLTESNSARPSSVTYDALGRKTDASYYVYGDSKIDYTQIISSDFNMEKTTGSGWITNRYDEYGRLLFVSNDNGGLVRYIYDGNTVTEKISPSEKYYPGSLNTVYNLKSNGSIESVTNSKGLTTKFTLDPLGNASSISNGSDPAIESSFNNEGQTSLTDPDAGKMNYKYNGYGELATQTDANENVTNNTYDALGRIKTSITTLKGGGSISISNTWDTKYKGQLSFTTKTTATGTDSLVFGYDEIGRCILRRKTVGLKSFSFTYQYDTRGRLQFLTYPNKLILQYKYNENNDIIEILNASNNKSIWRLSATDNGKITATLLADGKIKRQRSYQPNSAYISNIKAGMASGNDSSIQSYRFVWRENSGLLHSRSDVLTNQSEEFAYDALYRLESVWSPDSKPVQSVNYDPNGNLTFCSDVGRYTYDDKHPHALSKIGENYYNYAPLKQNISYTVFGKAEKIQQYINAVDTNQKASYVISYDANNDRCKTVYSYYNKPSITRYYFDGYEQTDSAGVLTDFCYISTPEGLSAVSVNKKTHYIYTDHLGSIIALSDSLGKVIAKYSYDAWGRLRNPSDWDNGNPDMSFISRDNMYQPIGITNRGYTGHEHLSTFGLINMNGRMYDPVLCRFLSPDNYISDLLNSQAYNRYSYCKNNPLNRIDPSGNLDFNFSIPSFSLPSFSVPSITIPYAAPSVDYSFNYNYSTSGSYGGYGYNFSYNSSAYFQSSSWSTASPTSVSFGMDGAMGYSSGFTYGITSPEYSSSGSFSQSYSTEWHYSWTYDIPQATQLSLPNISLPTIETPQMSAPDYRGGNDGIMAGALVAAAATSEVPPLAATILASATLYDMSQRMYVTYTLKNYATNQIYVGRASGYGDPYSVMMQRYSGHGRRAMGYSDPKLDRWAQGAPMGYFAIRGREQDLIDAYGKIESPILGNDINGISPFNDKGWINYRPASRLYFGKPDLLLLRR